MENQPQSIKMETNGSTGTPSLSTVTGSDQPSVILYQSITEIPLSNFIPCLTVGYLGGLIRSGTPTDDELLVAWTYLRSEFIAAMGQGEENVSIALHNEYCMLAVKYNMVKGLIELLQQCYDQSGVDMLNNLLDLKLCLDPKEPVSYKFFLQKAKNLSLDIQIDMKIAKMQYDNITEKLAEEGNPYDEEFFIVVLKVLSDFVKYRIDKTISVYEYCCRVNDLKLYNKRIMMQKISKH